MFCSTIIPTIGRPTLSRAVESVITQEFKNGRFEVIVVNDSGKHLPEAEWQYSDLVQIIHTNKRERSVARNTGASVAQGKYLHFLDDDDWMLPGAFNRFWELANQSSAAWLYGSYRLVDDSGVTVGEILPDEQGNCYIQLIAGEWLPLQASLIDTKAFFAVGGFAPLISLHEDVDLSRQIIRHYDVAKISSIVTCIRIGDESSTTDYENVFIRQRQSREKALCTTGAFMRLTASANAKVVDYSYWQGKVIYYYLASLKWNLQQIRLFTAASRATYAVIGLVSAGRHLLSARFWRGLSNPHYMQLAITLSSSDSDFFASTTWKDN